MDEIVHEKLAKIYVMLHQFQQKNLQSWFQTDEDKGYDNGGYHWAGWSTLELINPTIP